MLFRSPGKTQWIGVATGTMWVALGAAGAIGFHLLPPYQPPYQHGINQLALAALLIGLVTGLAVEFASLARKPWLMLVISALTSAMLVGVATVRVLPRLDALVSPRPLARDVHTILPTNETLFAVGEINRNCDYGLRFYLDDNKIPEFHQIGRAHV